MSIEDITPEKLEELLNHKTMQRIFQRFDENFAVKRGKKKYDQNEDE